MRSAFASGNKTLPGISIIVPTYNSAQTLAASLQSVVDQAYPQVEILIIDKESTDGTLEIAKQFQEMHGYVAVVSENDLGIYHAMNRGIELSRCEWIYFLGSDDVLKPKALEQVFTIADATQLDLVYGDVYRKAQDVVYDGEFSRLKLTKRNICHQAQFFNRRLFERLGQFNTRYTVLADWEFNWRCFGDNTVRTRYVPVVVAEYDDRGFSSRREDVAFGLDRPALLLQHFEKGLQAKEMHDLLWPIVCRYVEEKDLLRGLALTFKAGVRTRRPLRYLSATIFWKLRSVLSSAP